MTPSRWVWHRSASAWLSGIFGAIFAYIGVIDLNTQPAWALLNIRGEIDHGPAYSYAPYLTLVQFVVLFTLASIGWELLVDARQWPAQLASGLGLAIIGFVATGVIPGIGYGDPIGGGALWVILGGVFVILSALRCRQTALQARPSTHGPIRQQPLPLPVPAK